MVHRQIGESGKSSWKLETRDIAFEALLLSRLRSHAPRPAGGKLEQLLKFYETLWELMQTQASNQAEVHAAFWCSKFNSDSN